MVFGNSIGSLSGTANLFCGTDSNKSELKDFLTRLNDAIKQHSYYFVEEYRSVIVKEVQEVQFVLNRYEAYCKHYVIGRQKVLAELLTNNHSGFEEICYSWKDLSKSQLGKDLNSLISQETDGDYSLEDQKRLICHLCEFYLKPEKPFGCLIYLFLQLESNPNKADIFNEINSVVLSNFSIFISLVLQNYSEDENVLEAVLNDILEHLTPAHLEECYGLVDSLSKVWNFEHVDPQLQGKIRHTVCERLFPDEKTLFHFAREHQSSLSFLFEIGMRAPESSFSWGEVDRWPKSFREILNLSTDEVQYLRFLDYAGYFTDSRYNFHFVLFDRSTFLFTPDSPLWNKRDFPIIWRSFFYLISNNRCYWNNPISLFFKGCHVHEVVLDCFQNKLVNVFQFASSSYSLNRVAISQLRLGINVEKYYQKTAERVRRFQLDFFETNFKFSDEFERNLLHRFMLVYDGIRNKERVLCSLLVDVIDNMPRRFADNSGIFLGTLLNHLTVEHQDVFDEFIGSVLYKSDDFFKKLSLIAGYQESLLAKALFSRLSMFDNERSACLKEALESLVVGPLDTSLDESDSDSDDLSGLAFVD